MVETLRYARLTSPDMDWGFDTREVRLQNGALASLPQFHVGYVQAHNYDTFAQAAQEAQKAERALVLDTEFDIPQNYTMPDVTLIGAPGGRLHVAAGRTLTLDARQIDGGMWPMFTANNVTSGLVRFTKPIPMVRPEWWGIDPTGVTAGDALWAQVIAATTGTFYIPIYADGVYLLTGDPGIAVVTGLQILGPISHPAAGAVTHGGQFNYTGTGRAFYAASANNSVILKNLSIQDVNGTGTHGLHMVSTSGAYLENIHCIKFNTNFYFQTFTGYCRMFGLIAQGGRTNGFVANTAFAANIVQLRVSNNTSSVPVAGGRGLVIGKTDTGGEGGASWNSSIFASVEVSGARPVAFHHIFSFNAIMYIENISGSSAVNFDTYSMTISDSVGGSFNAYINVKEFTNRGLGLLAGATPADSPRNNRISGSIVNPITAQYAFFHESGEGFWGNDVTGLDFPVTTSMSSSGSFKFGKRLGNTYHTQATRPPVINEGRGSAINATDWQVGDIVHNSDPAPGEGASWKCTVTGNPGTWVLVDFCAGSISKTANFTVDADNRDYHFDNRDAGGTITGDLPILAASTALKFRFTRSTTQTLRINPNDADFIRGGSAAGKYLSLDSTGASVELTSINGRWEITSTNGTTSFEP